MNKLSVWYSASAFLISVGGGFIALQQSHFLPLAYNEQLKSTGALLIILGLAVLIGVVIFSLGNIPSSESFKVISLRMRAKPHYQVAQALTGDLDFLYDHYEALFGTDLVPKEDFSKWMIRNPKICFKVLQVRASGQTSTSRIVGFYDFEPLTSAALKRLRNSSPSTVHAALTEFDIRTAKTTARGYYIGSIGATSKSPTDRTATLLSAFAFARTLNSKYAITFFANPFTLEGLRLCKSFGFVKMNPNSKRGLWKLEMGAGEQIPAYEDKLKNILLSSNA